MIEIISATRSTESDFWNNSALGLSLRRLKDDGRLVARIAFENRRGLPEIFNARISTPESPDVLVFVHDDVWIDDYFLADRVLDGLRTYDVIGIAGNRRRVDRQPAWAFVRIMNGQFVWDDKANLSGSVAHGTHPFGQITSFGPVPADCELLDGVFLAARKSALTSNGVRFDPRFEFDFYDVDFCRTARRYGLRLGTWPICLTHQSIGAFGSKNWIAAHKSYIEKWKA